MASLSTAIVRRTSQRNESQPGDLWLLAYFIALRKAKTQREKPDTYAVALNQLLSLSSSQIRANFSARSGNSNESKAPQETLPPYISHELASLTDKDEIFEILQQLIRCVPSFPLLFLHKRLLITVGTRTVIRTPASLQDIYSPSCIAFLALATISACVSTSPTLTPAKEVYHP